MMVTTGGRGWRSSASSKSVSARSSSAVLARFISNVTPKSLHTRLAVSKSSSLLMLAITPRRSSFFEDLARGLADALGQVL